MINLDQSIILSVKHFTQNITHSIDGFGLQSNKFKQNENEVENMFVDYKLAGNIIGRIRSN